MILRKTFISLLLVCLTGSMAWSQSDTLQVKMGGALRFNYFIKNWEGEEANQKTWGQLSYDMASINMDVEQGALELSAAYRLYAGYSMLHHGYFGYKPKKNTSLQIGVTQVPFGNIPYTSHSYFFSMAYYIGMEDDYDLGVKWEQETSNLSYQLAFFKNSEGSYTGSSESSARYSYDVVGDNEEVNQGNARLAYKWKGGQAGISLQYGQLLHKPSEQLGDHWAVALHGTHEINRWDFKAEVLQYEYRPHRVMSNQDQHVIMGAYDFPYKVVNSGRMYIAGLSYEWPIDGKVIDKISFYNDFTFFDKLIPGFHDSQMNVLGMMVQAGPVTAYLDMASGQSHPWIGPVWSEALAKGVEPGDTGKDPKPEWATRLNLNIGYYF